MDTARGGFTLVEVVIAVVLLTAGLLALAGGTGHLLTQMSLAEARTARVAAIQEGAERVRAADYTAIASTCGSGSLVNGRYTVSCTVPSTLGDRTKVYLISSGPGLKNGRIRNPVVDTFTITIAKPVQ